MSYKPDESTWMAYLYHELDRDERARVEKYLAENPEAEAHMQQIQQVRRLMGAVEDKEVIAPPIFIDHGQPAARWNTRPLKIVASIAASLILLLLVGRLTDIRVSARDHEFKISFGEVAPPPPPMQQAPQVAQAPAETVTHTNTMTPEQVQQMINASLAQNNQAMQVDWHKNREQLDASIRENLALNSEKIDRLVQDTYHASQQQISDYVASIQTQNMQLVKDYFQLTATEQRQYIEDLLVDFSKYLQQQRNDDLMIMQARINDIEQHNDSFKQETEQILSSIITSKNNTSDF